MPIKPVKIYIEIWIKSDSFTEYSHEYAKKQEQGDGTLGESV